MKRLHAHAARVLAVATVAWWTGCSGGSSPAALPCAPLSPGCVAQQADLAVDLRQAHPAFTDLVVTVEAAGESHARHPEPAAREGETLTVIFRQLPDGPGTVLVTWRNQRDRERACRVDHVALGPGQRTAVDLSTCDPDDEESDGGHDEEDGGRRDGGSDDDGGARDAGTRDGGMEDGGADAGSGDAGSPDGGGDDDLFILLQETLGGSSGPPSGTFTEINQFGVLRVQPPATAVVTAMLSADDLAAVQQAALDDEFQDLLDHGNCGGGNQDPHEFRLITNRRDMTRDVAGCTDDAITDVTVLLADLRMRYLGL